MNKKISSLLLLSISFSLHSAILIQGDKDAPLGQTFSFNVNKNILSSIGNFYEGADENLLANQEFSLSRLMRGATAFMPLAPETVSLNNQNDSNNPLFGAKIIALGMLETEEGFSIRDMPVVVTEQQPAIVYLLEKIISPSSIQMVSSVHPVHDATGAISAGIVQLTTDIGHHVFAAVKPNGGQFGQPNSGIALLIRGTQTGTQNGKDETFRVFTEVNVNTGIAVDQKALQLDTNTPELFINNPLATIMQNHAVMHWNGAVKRLYVGLNVTANNGTNDGARSIAVIKFLDGGGITLEAIVPETALLAGNLTHIIGVIEQGQQLSVNALNSMHTSTGLDYLIVAGGNGDSSITRNSVFALPLVNAGDAQGMIAKKDAQPLNVFRDANVARLISRVITEPATIPADMTQSNDSTAQVGAGPLMAGPIVNIIVRDDTVFAFVGQTNSDVDPGVFSSQAIFEQSGKIVAWTEWQRAAGTTNSIFTAALNAADGNFILGSGINANSVNTIQRTLWSNGSEEGLAPLTTILSENLPAAQGGIQGLQTFLPTTPGLQNISLLAAGGIGTVVLAQTGLLNNFTHIIVPTFGPDFNDTITFDNGTITSDAGAKTVIISGGALDAIGPITALEIASNGDNGWLFVGGSDGLAILANPNGTGWDPAAALNNNFVGLQIGMAFKTVGNYQFIKKLVSDDNFLYVVSHSTIDRINLTTSNFGTNDLDITTIASVGNNGVTPTGAFLDGIFSQAFSLIATTNNLLRIGNNKDVRTITNQADAQWIIVDIAENAGAPNALYTVTETNRAQDITRNNGGHVYVLTADAGLDQSRINRFAVQPLNALDPVNTTTIQPFDDLFVKNIPSFLLSFGEFRSNFSTDGALYFATRNQNMGIEPVVLLTPSLPVPRVGVANVGDRSGLVNINLQSGTEINYFSRSQASGSWIAAGNFNTQVLE